MATHDTDIIPSDPNGRRGEWGGRKASVGRKSLTNKADVASMYDVHKILGLLCPFPTLST